MSKKFKLRAPDGKDYESEIRGSLGGYALGKIYGKLDCWSAKKFLANGGYVAHRVFFADESSAIASGFRPCGHCMKDRYKIWKAGGKIGSAEYPWLILPKEKTESNKFTSEHVTITRPQCLDCIHQDKDDPFRCIAYPEGIPNEILENLVDHHQAYAGDHGVVFSEKNRNSITE